MEYIYKIRAFIIGVLSLAMAACAANISESQRLVSGTDKLNEVAIVWKGGNIKSRISKRVKAGQKITSADKRHQSKRVQEFSTLLGSKGVLTLATGLLEYGITFNKDAQKRVVITPISTKTNIINTPRSITTLIFEVRLEDTSMSGPIWSATLQTRDGDFALYYNKYSEEKILKDFSRAIISGLKAGNFLGKKKARNKDEKNAPQQTQAGAPIADIPGLAHEQGDDLKGIMKTAYAQWSKGTIAEDSITIKDFSYGKTNPLNTKYHLLTHESQCKDDDCSGPLFMSGAKNVRKPNQITYCFTGWAKASDFLDMDEYLSLTLTCRDINTGKKFWFSDSNIRKPE